MKVSDVMRSQVDYVSTTTTIRDVSKIIFGRGVNGVPVCKDKQLVGFITERDILSKFYPSISEYIEDPVHAGDFEAMEKRASEIFTIPAEQIMSKNPISVVPDTPLLHAQSLMFIHKIGRLPVVNKKGELIGIISKGDIFRALVGDKLPYEENEQYHDWLSRRYDLIIDWKKRLEKEIPDLVSLFKKEKVKNVLDFGCGTGEHVIALAKAGFNAVGLDRSARMVLVSNEKTASLSPQVKKRVQFTHHGYRNLEEISQKFDAVLFMGTSLAQDPDPFGLLQEAQKILARKALVVVQVTNFQKILTTYNRLFTFVVRKSQFSATYEHAFLRFYDPEENGMLTLNTSVFDKGKKRWVFRGMNSVQAYPLTSRILADMFKQLQFSDITFYGGEEGFYYDYLFRKPFKPSESDVMVVVAKR